MNIILIGFKNCGKTTVGKMLSENLRYAFIDTDDLIREKHPLLSVREIYKKLGDEKFRSLEKEIVLSLKNVSNSIIATGGGCVSNSQNAKILKTIGKVIYLQASKETIKKRMFALELPAFIDAQNPDESFEKMFTEREKIYKSVADVIIDTEKSTIKKIDKEIVKFFEL